MAEKIQMFRFRPLSTWLWQEIELGRLYACSPDELNDPFDCRIDVISAINRALLSNLDPKRRERIEFIKQRFERSDPRGKVIGTICFSTEMTNSLMWSHYAGGHKGVCLMYEIPDDFFNNRYHHSKNEEFFFVGMSHVLYGKNYFTDWLLSGDFDAPEIGQPALNAATKLLICKSKDWEYEKEYRVLMSEPGEIEIPPEFLKQVAFGLKTPPTIKKTISQSVLRRNADTLICEAFLSGEEDFGIVFKDL